MNPQPSGPDGPNPTIPDVAAASSNPAPAAPRRNGHVSLKHGSTGRYWSADYLKPRSDGWYQRVHNYRPRGESMQSTLSEFFEEFSLSVAMYGNLPLGIASSVCRNVTRMYERSALVDRTDPAQVWNEANIRSVAAGLDAKQASREQFITQMTRIAYNYQAVPIDPPVPYTKKRQKGAPYTSAELEAFVAAAQAQPCRRTGWELEALICLGAGAGTLARDIRFLRVDEVSASPNGRVDVVVRGKPAARRVPVAEPWASRLVALIEARPKLASPWLILGRRDANLIHRLLDRADWADMARPLLSRLRTTWTYERLLGGCRIDTVRDLLGESTFTSIGHAATFLPHADSDIDLFRQEVTR